MKQISPTTLEIHMLLAERKQVAIIWSVEDVQNVRPDLSDEQAWRVLQQVGNNHDAGEGINWDVLECHAQLLFGEEPDEFEGEEE